MVKKAAVPAQKPDVKVKAPRVAQPVKKPVYPDGPDPRFKEGELFASWRRKGFPVSPLNSGKRGGNLLVGSVVDDFPPTGRRALDRLTKKVNAALRGVNDKVVKSFSLIRREIGDGVVILKYRATASVSCMVSIGLRTGEIRIRVDVAGQVRFAGPFVDMDFDRIRVALEVIFGGIR
jgi:hypothetical protein